MNTIKFISPANKKFIHSFKILHHAENFQCQATITKHGSTNKKCTSVRDTFKSMNIQTR